MARSTFLALLALAASLPCRAGDEGKGGHPGPRDQLLVSSGWLESQLGERRVVIVHVAKDRKGYDEGHIPGARFVAWSEVAVARDGLPNELPPVEALQALVRRLGVRDGDELVLYDEERGIPAARAYVAFDSVGLGERTALLDGQWKKWVAEGRPVSKETPEVEPSGFVAVPRPEVVATMARVEDAIVPNAARKTLLVDARPDPQFRGDEPGEGVARGGHIPGAKSVPFDANLVEGDVPSLRSLTELRALYDAAGIGEADEVVAYCRTGGQASMTYFVLKYLGYDPKLYDGSFVEWSADESNVVEEGGSKE